MRAIFLIAVLVWLVPISMTRAASINVLPAHSPEGIYSIYLDAGQYNGAFDTMSVRIFPLGGEQFVNIDMYADGPSFPDPGTPWTFVNHWLEAPIGRGGEGLTLVGKNLSSFVRFDATRLGGTIDTSASPPPGLFLANVMQTGPSWAEVDIIRAGVILETLTRRIPIPEPAGLLLVIAAWGALAAGGRRAGAVWDQRGC